MNEIVLQIIAGLGTLITIALVGWGIIQLQCWWESRKEDKAMWVRLRTSEERYARAVTKTVSSCFVAVWAWSLYYRSGRADALEHLGPADTWGYTEIRKAKERKRY